MKVEFTIPGPIVPWKRAVAQRGKRGRSLNPPAYRRYKRHIAQCGRYALLKHRVRHWPQDRQYRLRVRMYFQDLRTRDDDNVEKAVKDGLKGVLWRDDAWVYFDRIEKMMRLDRDHPRIELEVEVVDGEVAA